MYCPATYCTQDRKAVWFYTGVAERLVALKYKEVLTKVTFKIQGKPRRIKYK